MAKRALVTGITGQDGSCLTELLLSKGYEVHGIIRRSSLFNTDRIDHLYQDPHEPDPDLRLHYGDMTDGTGLRRILERVEPDEVYHLAAQSHVRVSFDQPEYTADIVATGTLRLLEAIRDLGGAPHARSASTRRAPRRCSAAPRLPSPNRPPSTRATRTPWARSRPTGSR